MKRTSVAILGVTYMYNYLLLSLKACGNKYFLYAAIRFRYLNKKTYYDNRICRFHSRPQSPRSFWSAPGIETSGRDRSRKSANHGLPAFVSLRNFETITVTIGYKNGQLLRLRISWPLPEVSIPGADQKDRGLWGRECADSFLKVLNAHAPQVSTRTLCVSSKRHRI